MNNKEPTLKGAAEKRGSPSDMRVTIYPQSSDSMESPNLGHFDSIQTSKTIELNQSVSESPVSISPEKILKRYTSDAPNHDSSAFSLRPNTEKSQGSPSNLVLVSVK